MVNFIQEGGPLTFDAITGFAINPFSNQNCWDASNWRDLLLCIVGTGAVTVYGSIQKDPVDFSLASAASNSYAPIVLADYSLANTYYNGTATVAGATAILELNTNLLTWVAFQRNINTVEVLVTKTNAQ